MKAVVIGATGATGRELVLQLLADKRVDSVTVLVRRSFFTADPKLLEVVVNFDKLEDFSPYIIGDIAFSTLGTTLKAAGSKEAQWVVDYDYQLKFAALSKINHINTFVLLSSAQASIHSRFYYTKMKGLLEEAIKALNFPKLIIVRPGPIDRPNTDRRAEKITIKMLNFFNKLGFLKPYKPISTMTLAKAIVESAFEDKQGLVDEYNPKEIWEELGHS
ncbi:Rossmann-fold NAD(P)-binding domain-containing protein [Sphingobacterium endophyticum]|uniref:NADH-quinone oxidoreductase subunit F n=1 Tax=Sphingobacterium endophyticum TaxID=2546448 RepID=UPI0018CCD7D5|nr:NADH-quinone oxidoreductase subunit F [Sphingobacterium endophyticum]